MNSLITKKISKFLLNNNNSNLLFRHNSKSFCSSLSPSSTNTNIGSNSNNNNNNGSTINHHSSFIVPIDIIQIPPELNNDNSATKTISSSPSINIENLKTFEEYKNNSNKDKQIEDLKNEIQQQKQQQKYNSEKDIQQINSLLYSNQDFQSIIKLFNSSYTASTEFLIEKSLNPLLLKTIKPEEPVKVKNRYILVGLGNPGEKYQDTRHNIGFKVIDRICEMFDCGIDQKNKHSEYTTLYLRLDDKQEKKKLMDQHKKRRLESQTILKSQFLEYLFKKLSTSQQLSQEQIDQYSDTKLKLETKLLILLKDQDLKELMNSFKNEFQMNFNENQKKQQEQETIIKPKKIIKQVILLKPQTFMNRSGGSVRNISTEFNVPTENILVFHDEITTNVGDIMMKSNGGSGNHNGVQDLIDRLGTQKFSRFRMGVGPKNNEQTSIFVLKRIPDTQSKILKQTIDKAATYSIVWLEKGPKMFNDLD